MCRTPIIVTTHGRSGAESAGKMGARPVREQYVGQAWLMVRTRGSLALVLGTVGRAGQVSVVSQ